MIENDLTFESASVNKIKMNHIKTMLCGHFIGIDKLERLKLLKNDPIVRDFDISVKEPETVSRFLGNFSFKKALPKVTILKNLGTGATTYNLRFVMN